MVDGKEEVKEAKSPKAPDSDKSTWGILAAVEMLTECDCSSRSYTYLGLKRGFYVFACNECLEEVGFQHSEVANFAHVRARREF